MEAVFNVCLFAVTIQFLLLCVKFTPAIHRCLLGQQEIGYETVTMN